LAAEKLRCSHTTIYNRIKASSTLQEAKQQAENLLVDAAVAGLAKKVFHEDLDAIKYTLNKLGKSRGFGDTSQVEHEHRGAIEFRPSESIEVVFRDDWRRNAAPALPATAAESPDTSPSEPSAA
jgi:hypothetical protein